MLKKQTATIQILTQTSQLRKDIENRKQYFVPQINHESQFQWLRSTIHFFEGKAQIIRQTLIRFFKLWMTGAFIKYQCWGHHEQIWGPLTLKELGYYGMRSHISECFHEFLRALQVELDLKHAIKIIRIMKKTLVFLLLLAFVLNRDVLLSSEKNIGTCAKYTSDKESCLECVPHYHLFEGQCYIDIHGCSMYVFGNICRKCDAGFILVNNECCDKHCMSRIFKNYEDASEQSDLTDEQKIERRITEGYEKIAESLSIFRYQFAKFVLLSTSNQVLQGYVRYFIKILANDKPYRCIADFEMDTKKVFILEFRLQAEMASLKQVTLSQQDVVALDEARIAIQYASGKFGLKTYGSSLERVSVNSYKYGSEFKLIYIGTEAAYIINIVVASGGSKKQTPYSPWSEQRKDVLAIKSFVQKSMSVVKMRNTPDIEVIKQKISESSSIKVTEVDLKTIEKVKENVYKYTFVNDQTKQVFEETSRINPKTKVVEIVEHKEVINVDVKNMKLPESPEKKIIPKDQVTENPQVKETIKYLEEVQPSLANKQIVNAAVETIGENKKVTLIQKKNDQISRVVVLYNERTNERKLVDESPVISTPPTETIYTTSPEGKPRIITTDVEKFKRNDDQVEKVITTIGNKLPSINTTNIVSFEKTEGNLATTYQVVVKGDKPEQPKQQVTVVQDSKTKVVKVVDVEEIQTSTIIEPVKRKPTTLPETEYKSPEVKLILQELKKTNTQFKDSEVVVKKVDIEEAKFANQYTVTVVTNKGETLTIKANKQHEQKQPEITSVKPILQKNTTTEVTVDTTVSYISKVTVDSVTGVKITTTTKPDDIQNSYVNQVLTEVTLTKTKPKVDQIESLVRKDYGKTVTETVVIKDERKFVQVTVEQNKQTGTVVKLNEQIIDVKPIDSQPVLPVIATTKISETTFSQTVKLNPVLKTVTETVVDSKPIYKQQAPISTEVEQRGSVQVVTYVYENKKTQEKERIVAEYNTETQKTVIKESTTLPKVIEKVVFEKDVTPQGDIKVISNKIDDIKKQDKHITTVVQQVSEKFPIIKDNSVRFEVVSNDISNTYQITAVEPKTKQTVTVSVSYHKQTGKVTVNDIQEQPKTETPIPKPIARPIVVLTPDQVAQPEIKNVVNFVGKTVDIQQVTHVKQIKNTLSTTYEVSATTSQGTKTVTVVVDNTNPSDVTLIDVTSNTPVKPISSSPQLSSYFTMTVDSANVKDTTTNDQSVLSTNKNLVLVSQQAASIRPSLKNQVITCFSEDVFKTAVQITYLATVSSTTVRVSGLVITSTSEVQILEIPDDSLTASTYTVCTGRSSTITTLTSDTVTILAQSDSEISSLLTYLSTTFTVSSGSIQKIMVEKFTFTVKYVILVTLNKTTQRIVLIYWRRTTKFTVVESPEKIQTIKPVVLDQVVNADGTKTIISNSIDQVKTVDTQVVKFIQTLSKDVPVNTNQVIKVISKQGTNTNEYTLTIKTATTTNEIKAVYKKDDDSVIVTQFKEEPQPLILPLIKPSVPLPKEEYTSPKVIKFVDTINNNKQLPDIKTTDIVNIVKTTCPTTTNYEIVTSTTTGNQTFVVSQTPKGDVTVIDYKPVEQPKVVTQPVKTEYTVNPVSGYQTRVTNDVHVIKQSVPIQSVVSWLVEKKTVTPTTEVISAVTKTLENQVQTTVVMRSPEKPTINTVVVAVVDKNTKQVTIVNEKKVHLVDSTDFVTPADEIIQTVYTTTVIQKRITEDNTLQQVVSKVVEINKEFQNITPSQVIMEKIGDKVLSTVTFEGKKVTTVVYDEKTNEMKVISTQPVPKNIKPLVYEIEKTTDGSTVITTNSPDRITDVTKNFNLIVSEIKQTIPTIQTEKIDGIKVIQSDIPSAPQKIVILFQSQKETEKTQIVVLVEPNSNKPIIADVQTIPQEEIIPTPELVYPVKLTTREIREQNIDVVISSNIKQLPFKEVRKVLDAQEVKTAYSTTLDVRVESTEGDKYVIKTQQFGNDQPKIVDYIKVTDAPKPQIFTVTTTNTKNGIISTYTNDLKVMSEEKTFNKCVDSLEKQRSLSKKGYVVDSETISRLQRSVEHQIRFVNKETNAGIDYRVIVDSRTGAISINEETPISLISGQPSTMPEQKEFMEIRKSEFGATEEKYDFIKNGRSVLAKADYTFEGKIPDLTQVKLYKNTEGRQSNVEVIFIFIDVVNGNSKKTRVVLLGEEKQSGKGYIMKIIDITTLPDVITSTETQIVVDGYNRRTISTNDVKTLEKNNQEYIKVIDQVREEVPSLNSAEVSSVVVKEMKTVNEYTMMIKKGPEIIETKAVYNKAEGTIVITDFKTQSTKSQVERVPIRETQSIVTEISTEKLASAEYVTLQQQIKNQPVIGQNVEIKSVKIEQNLKLDSYVIKIVDSNKVESTVNAYKNPTTQQITILSVIPDQPQHPKPTQTKEIITEIKVDSVTGNQIVRTNDIQVISQNPTIQNVVKKVTQQNTVSKSSEVVSIMTKTSETKIQSTIVMQEPRQPDSQTVIIAITDRKQPTQIEIVSEEIIEITEEDDEETIEEVVEEIIREVVITKNTYHTAIKKDTHLQKIVKTVQIKYNEVKDLTPIQVTMQEIGSQTLSEITYENKKFIVVTNEKQEVVKTYDEPVPKNITPGTVETTITVDGTKTTISTNTDLMVQVQPQFTQVLVQIKTQVDSTSIKTVVSNDTSFGTVYTVISQKPEETEPKQTIFYYNKETKTVISMGSEVIPVISVFDQSVPETEPVKIIPETKWTTGEVSTVITQVTKTVTKSNVTHVEMVVSPAPTVKFYHITVDSPQGPTVVTVTVDKTTGSVTVIDQNPLTPQPTPSQPQPSETTIVVNSVTGVKTTTSTDTVIINKDQYINVVQQSIEKNYPELSDFDIVSLTVREFDQKVEERVIYSTDKTPTEVVTIIDKQTQVVTVVDKFTVDSIMPTISSTTLTTITFQEVYERDEILRRAIEFVKKNQPQLSSSQPSNVNVEEFSTTIEFTFVFTVSPSGSTPSGPDSSSPAPMMTSATRVLVLYKRGTDTFEFIESPSTVDDNVNPIVFETVNTDQGRTNYFTNDVTTLQQYDTNWNVMFTLLTQDIQLTSADISSIQSNQTSTGNSYTIMISTNDDQDQLNVLFNQDTKTIKVTDISTVVQTVIQPTPRPSVILTKEDYSNPDVTTVISQSTSNGPSINKFTVEQVTKIEKIKTTFGTNYVMNIQTPDGNAILTTLLTPDQNVEVISYSAPTPQVIPLIAVPPSVTQFTVDSVTGTQTQQTNDTKLISSSQTTQTVVTQLVKTQVIPSDSTVVSTVTQTSPDTIQTILVVSSTQQSKVVVTVTNRKTNDVQVIAEKPIPQYHTQQPEISTLVPQTVISSTIYEEVIKRDTVLQNVIQEIRDNHPEITEPTPTQVVISKVGDKTVTGVSYQHTTYTVVTDSQTGTTKQVSTSTLPKVEDRKPVVLEQKTTDEGTVIVTSNKIEVIEKVVPTVRPAITEVMKVISFKPEEIKTIQTAVEDNQYTVVVVDQTNKVREIKFTYQPEQTTTIRLIDVQQFSEVVPTKPKEIVYESIVISEQPQIIKTIETLNTTSSIIKNGVTEIIKVQKAVTNFVDQYKVEVKTDKPNEFATITIDTSSGNQPTVIDVIRYVPLQEQPQLVVVQEKIDSVTQTRQTVFPTIQTYQQDETYPTVTDYLQNELTNGYVISSVVKQNYGENNEITVLLKSDDKSPQQVQLNINGFNKQVTILENRTIVSRQTEEAALLNKDQPKPVELTLNPVDQEKFEIISRLNILKTEDNFKTLPEIKVLEKNDLFKQADAYLKTQFESILQQSNIVYASTKQTLDSEEYKVYYINTKTNDKELYEAKIELNPITKTFDIKDFTKIAANQPQKSNLNIGSDIAYGYEPLDNFSNDKNLQFVVDQAKKHYTTLQNAVIQSVEVLSLCNGRYNYKIFFKNGLLVEKYIIYYEQAFQRVIFLAGKEFSFGGTTYETLSKEDLIPEAYFKNVNQHLKEKNPQIADGAEIVLVEREDRGTIYGYRVIYSKNGKTYHASTSIDKDILTITDDYFNQVIEIPVSHDANTVTATTTTASEQFTVLKINDLAHNSNFEKVYREILSKEGSFLQNAQLVGALQSSQMFSIKYQFYFVMNRQNFKIEAEIDSTTKTVTFNSELEKVNLDSGYAIQSSGSEEASEIIAWVQQSNPDLKAGVILEVSSKKEIFGKIFKVVFKLQTKFYKMVVYKEGSDLKILNQSESTSLDDSTPTVRSFPRPNRSVEVTVNQ